MKKLKLIVLTMILSLFLFAGVNVMAMDEDTVKTEEPKTAISKEAPKGIEGGNTADELAAEEKEEIVEEGNKEASAPIEDETTKTDVENVDMGGVPSSNIDTDKAAEPEDKKPSDAKEETKSEEKAAEEKVKQDDSKKSAETKPDDAKKDVETEEKPEEDKKQDETKDDDAKTDGEKAKEGKEENAEEKTEEGENAEANADAKELEVGTVLDPDKLTPLGTGPEGDPNRFEVGSFKDLVKAINDAQPGVETTIVITQSFEIKETIR